MDNSTLLRILTFSKPGNHRIIVIEGPVYTVAYAIKPLAGDNIVTAITHKQHEPETVPCVDPITTVVLLYRNPSKIIKSMVRDHYKNPRVPLIICIGDLTLTGAPALRACLKI